MSLFTRIENSIFSFSPHLPDPISHLAFTKSALEDTGTQKNTWNLVPECSLPEITTVDGKVGALFRGNGGLVNADIKFPNIAGDFTIEHWMDIFPECTQTDSAAPRNTFGKYYYGDGDYGYVVQTFAYPGQFYIQNCGSYVSVPNHTWHHVALTRKGKHVTFWLDGKLSSSYDYFRADALIRNVPFTIAINSSYTSSRFFNCSKFYGALRDFKIYDTCIYEKQFTPPAI